MSFLPPSGRRLAGAERLLRVSQEILKSLFWGHAGLARVPTKIEDDGITAEVRHAPAQSLLARGHHELRPRAQCFNCVSDGARYRGRVPGSSSSTDWRNGSASDSSPEGYAFESRIGH